MQTAEKQAEILKDQGNLYFKKERLAAAIEAYTEVFDPFPDFFFHSFPVRDLLMVMIFSSVFFFIFLFHQRHVNDDGDFLFSFLLLYQGYRS